MSECGWEGSGSFLSLLVSVLCAPFLYSLGTSCACLEQASHWVMAAVSCVCLFPTLDRELQDKSHAFLPSSPVPCRVPGTEVCLVNRCWRDEGRKVHVLYSWVRVFYSVTALPTPTPSERRLSIGTHPVLFQKQQREYCETRSTSPGWPYALNLNFKSQGIQSLGRI